MDSREIETWQLILAAELTGQRFRTLKKQFGTFFSLSPVDLATHSAFSESERQRMRGADRQAALRAVSDGAIILDADRLPANVAQLNEWPALFAWGNLEALDKPRIGIVGTRAASTYGKAAAQKFAEALAANGVTIVSGGALGIDAAAHKGALEAGGHTVAVLASGIDRVYPALHRGLFQQIRGNGCLISQFAAGSMPSAYRFLVRNQLVAALSDAVLVVEAPEKSGALSTAHAANERGRHVLVVPSNIDNMNFRGSHELIRDGATLVDHPDQVLEVLGIAPRPPIMNGAAELNEVQQRIVGVLSVQPTAAELIAERTGLQPSEVMTELTMLELDGRILRDSGGYAIKP